MRIYFSLIFTALLFFCPSHSHAQKMGRFKIDKHNLPVICKHHGVNHGHVVLPPAQPRNSPVNPAVFQATFSPNMPPAAIAAFEGATEILSQLLSSTIPINVEVDWEDLAPGALAGAGPSEFITEFPNSTEKIAYPIALAEKIAGVPLNGESRPDIFISIDNGTNWYYDFENPQNIANNQFDFVSVVLHELIHGLGFVGFATVTQNGNGPGRIKSGGVAAIYDIYMANGLGENLCNTIEDLSAPLADALQSNDLFIRTPIHKANNNAPKIYAPTSYQQGSSIHHLDQARYANTPNSLMTPTAARAQIEHDPGIAIDVLYELGWSTTTVLHEQKIGEDNVNEPYVVNANVISDLGYDANTLLLHYSQDTFNTVETIQMMATGEANQFTATIPAPNTPTRIQYYFTIEDSRSITLAFPAEAPNPLFYETFYEADTQLPIMQHTPVTSIDDKTTVIPVDAQVTDFFAGVDSVFVEYFINDVIQERVVLTIDFTDEFRDNLYTGEIELATPLSATDELTYRVIAVDKSTNKNQRINPTTGLHSIEIAETFDATITYLNDFNIRSMDFSGNGFSFGRPNGFADNAIQSQHPYPNAGEGKTLNFSFQLNIPIQIRADDPLIEFEEIVLVEPGEPGTNYTELEFWDYVIVEGRKIDEQEWKPFLDGYDSRANARWNAAYVNGLAGQNSTSAGTPDLFQDRTINMVANNNFRTGDIVFIRFRLFSDPFAYGWGWAIDNLRIQDANVAVEDFIAPNDLQIYPNPVGTSMVNISANFKHPLDHLQIDIHDSYGRLVTSDKFTNLGTNFSEAINVSEYANGLYLVTLRMNGVEMLSRRIIKVTPE